MTRHLFAFALVGLLACAKAQTTAPGRIAQVDLSTKLPEGIRKGPDDSPKAHERTAEVCAGERAPGASVVVRWETFSQGDNHYIANYEVELTKPVEGQTVTVGDPQPVKNANPKEGDPYVGMATIVVQCAGASNRNDTIQIRADGKTTAK